MSSDRRPPYWPCLYLDSTQQSQQVSATGRERHKQEIPMLFVLPSTNLSFTNYNTNRQESSGPSKPSQHQD